MLVIKTPICCCGDSLGALRHEVHVKLELGLQTKSRKGVFTHTLNSACVKGAWWHTTQARSFVNMLAITLIQHNGVKGTATI